MTADTFLPIGDVVAGIMDRLTEGRPKLHEPGIYFGLDEATYHRDPALGSTDIRRLLGEPADYWWNSHMNPAKPDDGQTEAQKLGSALHKLVLEGRAAFDRKYVRRPDDVARMTDAVRQKIAPAGQDILSGEDFDRVLSAGAMILANEHLRDAFVGGMSEVSVFWTDVLDDGFEIRRKARFDYLKPRAVVDLKSTRPTRQVPFKDNCKRALAEWAYPFQAAGYMQGRRRVPELISAGRVFGAVDGAFLDRLRQSNEFAFVFVFWASSGAPLAWGTSLSPSNPIITTAEDRLNTALTTYRDLMKTYGPNVPWIVNEPVSELDINDLPPWALR